MNKGSSIVSSLVQLMVVILGLVYLLPWKNGSIVTSASVDKFCVVGLVVALIFSVYRLMKSLEN